MIELEAKNPAKATPAPAPVLTNADNAASSMAKFREIPGLQQRATSMDIEAFLEADIHAEGSLAHARWRFAHILYQPQTRLFFISMVCINAVLIGVQTDYPGGQAGDSLFDTWVYLETAFVSVFIVEIGLKLFGFGYLFFADPWNVLDFVIISTSVAELVGAYVGDGGGERSGLSALRLLRVMRVIRLLSFLERLNLLVKAFLFALKDVVWVGILIILMLYIFAILACGFFGKSQPLADAGFDTEGHFGSVFRSMVTLFQMITMDSWMSGITRPIGNVYFMGFFFFIFFVILAALGLLNLLTAIFIETLAALSSEHGLAQMKERKALKKKVKKFAEDTFRTYDTNKSGTLDIHE